MQYLRNNHQIDSNLAQLNKSTTKSVSERLPQILKSYPPIISFVGLFGAKSHTPPTDDRERGNSFNPYPRSKIERQGL